MNELENILEEAKSNLFLTEKFSPVIRISAFFSFKYFETITEVNDNAYVPFFLSFPDKKSSSVWLTTLLQLSFFLEDYVNNQESPRIKLIPGTKYSIYGSIGVYQGGVFEGGKQKYRFSFKEGDVLCHEEVIKIIKNVNQNRAVNKLSHYTKKRREAKDNRTPLSKIFEPDEGVIINDDVFTSKILLITGRGNTRDVNRIFENTQLQGGSIKSILSTNDNIIIRPDLKDFVSVFDNKYANACNDFTNRLDFLIQAVNQNSDLHQRLNNLYILINSEEGITEKARDTFDDIVENFIEEDPRLNYLKNIFPGVRNELPNNLRVVIINDISQVQLYPKTINGFLNRKIPVIILADKLPKKIEELDSFNQWFEPVNGTYKDAWRFNWSKNKLEYFNEMFNQESVFFDRELWNICKRYSYQSIEIKIFDTPQPDLDSQINFLRNKFVNLNGFENLKTAFYQYLYPALWALKNSNNINDVFTHQIINSYRNIWIQNKGYLNDDELRERVDTILENITNNIFTNTKEISGDDLFCISTVVPNLGEYRIPLDCGNHMLPDVNINQITFSGFPFKEFTSKHLINAVLKYFIPEIRVLCWPQEGKSTFRYLKRRIIAGYFTDNLPAGIELPDSFLLKNDEDIEQEINTLVILENQDENIANEFIEEEEDDFIKLDNLQYEKYKIHNINQTQAAYSVKCNILRFEDGCFMFLPSNSRLLGDVEGNDVNNMVRKLKFNDLAIGTRIYKINGDIDYDQLLENNDEIRAAYEDLNKWKNLLEQLYEHYNTEEELSNYLSELAERQGLNNANPNILNLRRWMNDDDMIAPNKDNLTVLILAGIDKNIINGNSVELVDQIMNASSFIRGVHIKVGGKIKTAIANQLNNNQANHDLGFSVCIPDTDIDLEVEVKTIVELQKSEIEVEYSNTRKFLC